MSDHAVKTTQAPRALVEAQRRIAEITTTSVAQGRHAIVAGVANVEHIEAVAFKMTSGTVISNEPVPEGVWNGALTNWWVQQATLHGNQVGTVAVKLNQAPTRSELEMFATSLAGAFGVSGAMTGGMVRALDRVFHDSDVIHVAVVEGPEHRLLYANEAVMRTLGNRIDVRGMTASEVFSEVRDKLETVLDRVYLSGEAAHFVAARGNDGRFYDVIYQPVMLDDVIPLATVVYAINVQEYILDRMRAQANASRLDTLFSTLDIGIWEIDVPYGALTYVNDAAVAILGHARQDWEDPREFFERVVVEEDRERVRRRIRRAIEKHRQMEVEFQAITAEGKEIWLHQTITPERIGEQVYLRGVMVDVTAKRLEAQRREALQAQLAAHQRMEALGRLAGGVAHDFNNLLTVILGCCNLVLQDDDLPAHLRQDIRQIYEAGKRSSSLTRQLLAFGGRQVLSPRVIDLHEMLDELERMLTRALVASVVLDIQLHAHDARVVADPMQLEQAIVNLVVNARDAMPDGGTITLETQDVDDAFVRLSVRDSGVGIPAEFLEQVVEPFFTTKPVGEGTGLGLAMVHGFVSQSGGAMWFESEVDQGTAVILELPRGYDRPGPRRTTSLELSALESENVHPTVLLVEDDPAVRRSTRRLLSDRYTVIEAANVAEAREVFAQHRDSIDLLLVDVVMPDGNGPELVGALRAGGCSKPVVFISGYAANHLPDLASLEPARFLPKPFTSSQIHAILHESYTGFNV